MKSLAQINESLVTGAGGFKETDSISFTQPQSGISTQPIPTDVGNNNSVSPLSRHLTFPSLPGTTNAKKLPMARLLTSDQCLAELEEKERSKELAVKEKERKKKERKNKSKKKRS